MRAEFSIGSWRTHPIESNIEASAGPGMSLAIDETAAFNLDKTVGADPRFGKKM
jgi:hypothetical protein